MGLYKIDTQKPAKCGLGYAVRLKTPDGYEPVIRTVDVPYKLGVEYRAKGYRCHMGFRSGKNFVDDLHSYPIGFHLFRSLSTARKFKTELKEDRTCVIVQYHYSDAHTQGWQGYNDFEGKVIVARKVTIIREIK